MQVTTNSSGQTNVITLPCPDKSLSLSPQQQKRPYATYNMRSEKAGLTATFIQDVEVMDDVTSIQNIVMPSDPLADPPAEGLVIPAHSLWGNYPPQVVVDPTTQDRSDLSRVLTQPFVPEYVVVHDGLPTDYSAPNYYVLFSDYIKNVASSEIYATWPVETLKANIYAILSFTMNRIYSEWYLSKGYQFTITSSTQYDQKFIFGRNIYKEIAQVVDSVFSTYIQRGNKKPPFFSQYNDGIRVNNEGWLSQWGSKELGDKGYSAIEILKYYYGDDVTLAEATQVNGVPSSFPGYNLQVGVCGEPVQKIQLELNIIRGSFPLLPLIQPTDGQYGAQTKKSVETFQYVFSLPVTGVVDFATWYRVSYVFIGVSKMLAGRYS